jgi:hypothetical protein
MAKGGGFTQRMAAARAKGPNRDSKMHTAMPHPSAGALPDGMPTPTRSNAGGATRGQARAAQVQAQNTLRASTNVNRTKKGLGI